MLRKTIPSRLVSIDPASRNVGYAYFEHGILKFSGHVSYSGSKSLSDMARSHGAVMDTVQTLRYRTQSLLLGVRYVSEWAVVIPGVTRNPNDLRFLWAVALGVGERLEASEIEAYEPVTWRCGTTKETTGRASESNRGREIRRRLSPEELAVAEDQHDADDAVGIGLYDLGRFNARRFYTA